MNILMFFMKLGTTAGTLEKISMALGLSVGFLFGGWTELLTTLLVIQVLDICTGLLVGFRDKAVSSKRMRDGFSTKIGYWIMVILAHLIDSVLLDGQMVAQTTVVFGFIAVESLSITENLGILGVNIPPFILKYLQQVRDANDVKEINIGTFPEEE